MTTPNSISRPALLALITAMGLEPEQLVTMLVTPAVITVKFYRLDEAGNKVMDEAGNEYLTDAAMIAVEDSGTRNVHCSRCGDTRGGPIGHETSECTCRRSPDA